MNYQKFQEIMHFSENRNKDIQEREETKKIMEELEIPQY